MEEIQCAVKKKNLKTENVKEKLKNEVILKMVELGLWSEDLQKEIPTNWDSFNNFVVFNRRFFSSNCWEIAGQAIWETISKVFSGKAVAFQGKIQNNDFRSPSATVVYGDCPWAQYRDNGILYTWNVEFTMFCTGNASERHRIAEFDCQTEVVVDMFAGIGYFVLPYLVHAKAQQVIACEWNPVSVEALKLNLSKNSVAEKCDVFEGDVRTTCPRNVADHINMGLIPSCEQYWPVAVEILKPSGGTIHVHGNVSSKVKSQNYGVQCEQCTSLLLEMSIDPLKISCDQKLNDYTFALHNEDNKVQTLTGSSGSVKWKKLEWFIWGLHVSHSFCNYLITAKSKGWKVTPKFLHRVKTYAPHIDHLVIDILCEKYDDC